MRKRLEVKYKLSSDGTRYYYVDIGRENHGKPSFRLWISPKLIQKDNAGNEFVEFPVYGRIIREKGISVLKSDPSYITHYIFVESGFRGGAGIEIEYPDKVRVLYFDKYRSPVGRLGVSVGAIITIPKDERLIYKWWRNGKLYGKQPKSGRNLVMPDGSEVELCEEEEDLKKILSEENEPGETWEVEEAQN